MKHEQLYAIRMVKQSKVAIRREGYNRGVRAAMRSARDSPADELMKNLKALLKPPLDSQGIQICGTKSPSRSSKTPPKSQE